jgi:hypothetical protein
MAISSASTRIFKAEDPVMETDLSLLAKVNEFQQDKFDEGEKELQNEINNWAMLSNVAKPQDRDYINQKLSKLVSGIQNMGGVNLADHNVVNALKSQGYNLYGDENVMNPVVTTRKMNALQQDIYQKTNGKNAKDYDSVYGDYLVNQYSDWLNDGKQGTKFDGPIALPQGSFDAYNKKIEDTLNKLTPDINEAPQNAKDALNYYQVGDKFIKKERVEAAINAVTSAQDRDIMSAHAWKQMSGVPDSYLVGLQRSSYDSKLKNLQDTYNDLQYNKAHTSDYAQKELFTGQMAQIKSAIDQISGQRKSLPQLGEGEQLDKNTQKQLRDNLFDEAFKNQWSNARAFEQKKVELKMNQGKAFQLKMDQTAWMFGKNYDLKVKDLGIKEKELQLKENEAMVKLYGLYGMNQNGLGRLGITGPAAGAPLSIVPNKGGDDATVLSDDVVKQADANYIAKANNFYTQGYNYLMGKDADLYGKYLRKDSDGNWIPRDEKSRDVVNKGLQSAMDMYGNIANMSIKERNGLNLSDDDINLFNSSKDLRDAQLYKDQMNQLTDQVFRKAGYEAPSSKNITINFKDGTNATVTYEKLKEMIDREDPKLKDWKNNSKTTSYEDTTIGQSMFATTNTTTHSVNSFDTAVDAVKNYYDNSDVKKAWKDASKDFNVYGATVNLPKQKNGKPVEVLSSYLGTVVREQHPGLSGGVQNDDIDLLRVYPVYRADSKDPTNKVRYMAEVRYQKGSGSDKEGKDVKGDRITTVDLTDQVMRDHENPNGGYFGNLFPNDNEQVVYGMLLNNSGRTPLDKNDNYASALQTHSAALLSHKYQIVAMRNNTNGVDGYRINILIPKGKDQNGVAQYQTLPVINFDALTPTSKTITNTFPANFKYVQDYMEDWFSDSDKAREFYRRHNIPYVSDQTNQ